MRLPVYLVTKISRFQHTFEASVNAIDPIPGKPAKSFGDQDITSLAATMDERGQLQPSCSLRRNTLGCRPVAYCSWRTTLAGSETEWLVDHPGNRARW